jgi:hypothetical protein
MDQMSGFIYFMFHSNATVSIHIPMNFDVEDLIYELNTNLMDIYIILQNSHQRRQHQKYSSQRKQKHSSLHHNNRHQKLFI